MRLMEIPRFQREIEILDLENFYRTRLSQRTDIRAAVAVPLLSYMGWPNDQTAREESARMLKSWMEQAEQGPLPPGMTEIQRRWARVADIVHLHYDLHHGRHQQKRGGSSIGKAVFLVSETARSRGTGQATGW